MEFQMMYASRKKDPTIALVLSLFLGGLGVDRFYLGDVGLGVLKLLTFGACGFWVIIDWFLIMGAAEKHNTQKLMELQAFYSSQLAPVPQPGSMQSYPSRPG